jgi:hypothetical protein
MSGQPLSTATRALLQAAKADGPSAAARAKVWSGVTSAIGGAAAGAGAGAGGSAAGTSAAAAAGATSAAASGLGAMKMLVIGTLLGGSITVGLATTMLQIGPSPRDLRPDPVAPAFAAAAAAAGPSAAVGLDRGTVSPPPASVNGGPIQAGVVLPTQEPPRIQPVSAAAPPRLLPHPKATVAKQAPATHAGGSSPANDSSDALAREASLVAEARAALARGDAQSALRMVRTARSLPTPQLVPEELAVERQALRMLGSADEARGVEQTLRTSYPDSALAR